MHLHAIHRCLFSGSAVIGKRTITAAMSDSVFDCSREVAAPIVIPQHRRLQRSYSYGVPRLSPQEVSSILRVNESSHDINLTSVRGFDANQLPSNSPIEDRWSAARCRLTTGTLFGIFDGHGGWEVADLVSQRLFDYIALSLLPYPLLKEIPYTENVSKVLLDVYDEVGLPSRMKRMHDESIRQFTRYLLENQSEDMEFSMQRALIQSFIHLDSDLSREIQSAPPNDLKMLSLALMGSCACIAHVDGSHLHIANCGDCHAVLGVLSDNDKWTCRPLGAEHNTDNVSEINRVMSEHPKSEINTVIKNERLLGQLAPLRAFADFPYKWKTNLQQKLLVPAFGSGVLPPNYYTPPYLTVVPDVIHHRLTPRDKFLIIASDGLWEQMLPHKVVKFVGEHMSGKQTLDMLKLPRRRMSLDEINGILDQRQVGLSKKISDTNAATHLLRNALGRTEYGIEHSKLSAMLTLPDDMVRNFRDDISIIIIYFDTEYLRHSPAD